MRPALASPELQKMLRTLRLIVGAIVLALVAFLAVGTWKHLGPVAHPRPADASFFTWVAVAWGLTQPLMFAVVRMAMVRQAVLAYDPDDLAPFRSRYMAAVIVAAAGVEAAGLLSALAYLLEGRLAALFAGALCAGVILIWIPTRRRVDRLIDERP